jgi:trypsin-like peptidase
MQPRNAFDDLFFTTVRIEAHPESDPNERRFGTAFLVERVVGGVPWWYLVSCRHVVESAETGVIYFMEGGGGSPLMTIYPAEINHFQLGWVPHPNPRIDIAVMRVTDLLVQMSQTEGKKVFARYVRESDFLSEDRFREFGAIEDVLFVGYPGGVYDHRNGLPIVRRGITASPVFVDFEGDPAFLVDGAVRGGSSGSPVSLGSPAVKLKPDGSLRAAVGGERSPAPAFRRGNGHRTPRCQPAVAGDRLTSRGIFRRRRFHVSREGRETPR